MIFLDYSYIRNTPDSRVFKDIANQYGLDTGECGCNDCAAMTILDSKRPDICTGHRAMAQVYVRFNYPDNLFA